MSQIWVGQEKSCFTQNPSLKWVISLQTPIYPPTQLARVSCKEILAAALFFWRPDHSKLKSTGSLPSIQWNKVRNAGQNFQPGWLWWELRESKSVPSIMNEPFRLSCQLQHFLLWSHPTCHNQLFQTTTQCKGLQQVFGRQPLPKMWGERVPLL